MADLSVVTNPLTHWRRPRLSNTRKPRRASVEFQPTSHEPPSFRPRITSLPTTTTRLALRPLDKAPSLSQLPPSRPPPSRPPQNRPASLSMAHMPTSTSTEFKMLPRISRQASLPPPTKAPPMRPDKKLAAISPIRSSTMVISRKVPPPPPSPQPSESPIRFSEMTVGELLNFPPQRAAPTRSASLSGITTARSRALPLVNNVTPSTSSLLAVISREEPRKPRVPPPPPPLPVTPTSVTNASVSSPGSYNSFGSNDGRILQASDPISPSGSISVVVSGPRRQRAVDACLKAERE